MIKKAEKAENKSVGFFVGLLMAASFFIPLAASKSVSWHFSLPKLVLIGITSSILIIYLSYTLISKALSKDYVLTLYWQNALMLPAGFFALAVLSTLTSVNIPTSILGKYGRYEGLITLSCYGAIFWFAFQHQWERRELRALMVVAVTAGVIVSIYAISQFIGYDPIIWGEVKFESNRAFSTFGNPSLLSGYLVLVIFLSFGLFLDISEIDKKPYIFFALTATLINSLALFSTLTRGGWLAGIVGIIFMVASLIKIGMKRALTYTVIALILFIIISLALSAKSYSAAGTVTVRERLSKITTESGTVAQRLEIWKAAVAATCARPWLGWGPDNFRAAFTRYETKTYLLRTGPGHLQDNAHNYPLQLAATMGLPAAVLFIVGFIWVLVISIQRSFAERDVLLISVQAALFGYFINILFVVNVVGAAFLFWLFLGVSLSFSSKQVKSIKLSLGPGIAIITLLFMLAVVQLTVPALEYAADHSRNRATRLAKTVSFAAALPDYKRAIDLNPWLDRYNFDLGSAYFYRALRSGRSAEYNSARTYFLEARRLDSYNVDNQLFLAQTEIFAWENSAGGNLREARFIVRDLLEKQPLSLSARYLSALVYYDEGNFGYAKEEVLKALELYPAYADAKQLLGVINSQIK